MLSTIAPGPSRAIALTKRISDLDAKFALSLRDISLELVEVLLNKLQRVLSMVGRVGEVEKVRRG